MLRMMTMVPDELTTSLFLEFGILFRSSRPEVFCKKGVLRNFANSQENTCARASFLIKLQVSGAEEKGLRPATLF